MSTERERYELPPDLADAAAGREQTPCACGEIQVATDDSHRTELDGIPHGMTPCFACDTYGVSFDAPLTPEEPELMTTSQLPSERQNVAYQRNKEER